MIEASAGSVILLRHGESTANAAGIFTGVLDVPLTSRGRAEAEAAASLIDAAGFRPTRLITSALTRAVETGHILAAALPTIIRVGKDWRLNERNYGALTGLSKEEVRVEFGEDQFLSWRRSANVQPPPMPDELFDRIRQSPPFQQLPGEALTRTESLTDVIARVRPVLATMAAFLAHEEQVVVVAHGNSLRALRAVIDFLTSSEIQELNIPTGQPFVYPTGDNNYPLARHGRYLDPTTAAKAAQQIALEGGT